MMRRMRYNDDEMMEQDQCPRSRRRSSSASQPQVVQLNDPCPVHQHLGARNHKWKDCIVRKAYVERQAAPTGDSTKKRPPTRTESHVAEMEEVSPSFAASRWGSTPTK